MLQLSFHAGGMSDKPLPFVVKHLSALGYDGIELMAGPQAHLRTGEPLEPQIQSVRSLLHKHHLQAAAINPYTVAGLVNMAKDGGDPHAFFTKLMDIAVGVGAPTVNFLSGWDPSGDTNGWKTLITTLKPLCHYAEHVGVNLAVHNHEAQIIDTPDKCLRLIEAVESPRLQCLCDITNFHILGCDLRAAVERLSGRIAHCHVKGVIGKYPYQHYLVPGETGDELPFNRFARALARAGYAGFISAECFSYQREDKAQLAFAMLSSRLKKLKLRH